MSGQHYCLRWNNYQSNMTSVFHQLLQNEAFVDVTLACNDLSLKAHKVVLSACSSYFQKLLLENPCKHPTIIMPQDVCYADLKFIIEFVYKGEIDVSQTELQVKIPKSARLFPQRRRIALGSLERRYVSALHNGNRRGSHLPLFSAAVFSWGSIERGIDLAAYTGHCNEGRHLAEGCGRCGIDRGCRLVRQVGNCFRKKLIPFSST
ncbi:hypothetical protein Zmor_008090 [Zophobas morio]|uniref:BTB domain-containing protein n=1 Tax=Zophobas morio TaxID=2755281 RepID=A0AA38M4M6_9CUCU|nr:hypothetical protein Zmor_025960 [Zophobas morio]KAJ3663869.1 hypothetical protein Zmor_008090 [Zophobas morio]